MLLGHLSNPVRGGAGKNLDLNTEHQFAEPGGNAAEIVELRFPRKDEPRENLPLGLQNQQMVAWKGSVQSEFAAVCPGWQSSGSERLSGFPEKPQRGGLKAGEEPL